VRRQHLRLTPQLRQHRLHHRLRRLQRQLAQLHLQHLSQVHLLVVPCRNQLRHFQHRAQDRWPIASSNLCLHLNNQALILVTL
jgi:hypothetical protein